MRFLLLILLLSPFILKAQAIGLHPQRIDWQQIDTDSVRVIYPAGYEATAQRVAKLVHRLQANHRQSIGDQYFKFDLILQTENIAPNAYVGLAPFRSEFFTTPPQSFNQLGLTDWVDLLTIHEFRHVQQNSNERRGITKLFSFLQGQYGWAVLSGIATPNWFSEGDAVVMETTLTKSGRGSLPAFLRQLNAMEMAGIRYSYAKSRNGSFKDLVPSHYPYGYLYTTYARRKFGNDVWKNVLANGAAYKSLIYPFSRALKKETGLSTPELYDVALDDFRATSATTTETDLTNFEALSPVHREPSNYRFPHPQPDGSIIALRTTFKRTAEVVRILPDQSVKVLTQVGFQREPYLDVQNGLAVWNETGQHPRYQNESYSDILVYDIESKTKRKITKKGRYLSPSVSSDRKKIVAATYHPMLGTSLAIMDARENPEITILAASQTDYYAWPVFAPDGKAVYALNRRGSKLAIIKQELTVGKPVEFLADFSRELKDNLTAGTDGMLYYTSPRNGSDQIYRLDPVSLTVTQLTNHPLGAYQPGLGQDGKLVFSSAMPFGLQLARQLELSKQTVGREIVPKSGAFTYTAEGENVLDTPLADTDFATKDFSDKFGGIKLHSWSYNGNYVQPGFTLEATNALNTVQLEGGLEYNYNEARTASQATFRYGGLFPVVEVSANYRERSIRVADPAFVDSLVTNLTNFNQLSITAGLEVPLRWLTGNYLVDFTPSLSYSRIQLNNRSVLNDRLPNGLNSLNGSLTFRALRRTAVQQVQSRLGISINLRANSVPGGNGRGSRFLLRTNAFLPGLARNHGIRIDLDIQREKLTNAYQYPDQMQYARGFYAPLNDQAYRVGINYQLPLLYPDFGIAGITYFKRIRLNAFYDIGAFNLAPFSGNFEMRSTGGQLFFDNVWLNAQDITVGIQAAYRLSRDFFADPNESDLRFRVLVEGSF